MATLKDWILFLLFIIARDFFSLGSNTAEISEVSPDLIIFSVLSAETTLTDGVARSINIELIHKSLIANKVPFTNTLLKPFVYTLGKLASAIYLIYNFPY